NFIVHRNVPRRQPYFPHSAHQPVDDTVELIQITAFLDDVTEREIAIHLAVTKAPREAIFRIEPDQLFGALAHLLQHPLVGQVVIVARVAEYDDGGLVVYRGNVVAVKTAEGTAEIGMRKHVDDAAAEGLLDGLVDLLLLEQLGDLA